MSRVVFSPKRVGDTVLVTIDFTYATTTGDTVLSAVCSMSVYSGVDSNPSLLFNGTASVINNHTAVSQSITGGIAGVVYELKCTATTTSGQTPVQAGYLVVEPDLP
jgi:hypothetical protein